MFEQVEEDVGGSSYTKLALSSGNATIAFTFNLMFNLIIQQYVQT